MTKRGLVLQGVLDMGPALVERDPFEQAIESLAAARRSRAARRGAQHGGEGRLVPGKALGEQLVLALRGALAE